MTKKNSTDSHEPKPRGMAIAKKKRRTGILGRRSNFRLSLYIAIMALLFLQGNGAVAAAGFNVNDFYVISCALSCVFVGLFFVDYWSCYGSRNKV